MKVYVLQGLQVGTRIALFRWSSEVPLDNRPPPLFTHRPPALLGLVSGQASADSSGKLLS